MNPSLTTPTAPESKLLLNRLRTEGGVQRNASLDRLEQACDAIARARGELTAAEVGRRCRELFGKGPGAQSIRNDPSGFAAYVALRRAEHVERPGGRPRPERRRSAIGDMVEAIKDPDTRARLRVLVAENADLRRERTLVAAALAQLDPGLDLDRLVRGGGSSGTSGRPPMRPAGAEHVACLEGVLRVLTSDDALRPYGLTFDGKRLRRAKAPHTEFLGAALIGGLVALRTALLGPASTPDQVMGVKAALPALPSPEE